MTASKDATIYRQQSTQNTGLDEILEVSKTYIGTLKDIAHTLIKFETGSLSGSIASGAVTMSSADLILRECESDEIQTEYSVYAYPVSQSWEMGVGTRFDDVTTQGTTWEHRRTSTNWLSGSYTTGTTGSATGSGGTWYTGSESSQSFNYQTTDIVMDVSTPLTDWIAGTIPNEGFILKLSDTAESNVIDYGQLKFFSKETNTIYQPKIRIGWDDSQFATGSLTELTANDISIRYKRLKTKYRQGSTPKILVIGREQYPLKSYATQFSYTDIKYLPATSWYQIKDTITHEIVIPYGDYSKLSCDSTGNYFKLNLTNWETNRDYYIEIKVERSGVIEYFSDDDLTFTVESSK